MESKKTIYSFLGLPASGKGTQADFLAQKLDIAPPIGMGELIREVINTDSSDPFVAEIKARYDKGIPQPDSVAIDLLRRKLDNSRNDIILDNFPLTSGQARFLCSYLLEQSSFFHNLVIVYIKIDSETAIKRATSRKICSDCGEIYAETDEMICDKCGGALIVRTDDNVDTIKARINHYLPKINEVLDYCRTRGEKIIEIDGEKSIAEVSGEIEAKI